MRLFGASSLVVIQGVSRAMFTSIRFLISVPIYLVRPKELRKKVIILTRDAKTFLKLERVSRKGSCLIVQEIIVTKLRPGESTEAPSTSAAKP